MSDGGAQPEEGRLVCAILHYTCVLNTYLTVHISVFQYVMLKKNIIIRYNKSDWKFDKQNFQRPSTSYNKVSKIMILALKCMALIFENKVKMYIFRVKAVQCIHSFYSGAVLSSGEPREHPAAG